MKIEKLSENQIRCTLNKSDLASRQLKISELAYGSDKAKALFRDMMQQASFELGFEADDIPLMIEAIPVSSECIVLIVTKVDDPEELDTRFSKFSPSSEEDDSDYGYGYPLDDFDSLETIESYGESDELLTAGDELSDDDRTLSDDSVSNDVLNLFSKVKDYLNQSNLDQSNNSIDLNAANNTPKSTDDFIPLQESIKNLSSKFSNEKLPQHSSDSSAKDMNLSTEHIVRIFSFRDFDTFAEASHAICAIYTDSSSLYKSPQDNRYYLTLEKKHSSSVNFNKTCNILSEYGSKENRGESSVCYFEEHLSCIIRGHAVQVGAKL